MYRFNGKELYIQDKTVTFEHKIRKCEKVDDNYIVLLEIPFSDDTINNIFCINQNGDIKWKVEDLREKYTDMKNYLPYEQFVIEDEFIYASDFYGRNYKISMSNGTIAEYSLTR